VNKLPIIRDPNGDFVTPCCPRPGGTKELHKVHRTLPARPSSGEVEDVLLDEAGIPILDEQTGVTIFDDWKDGQNG